MPSGDILWHPLLDSHADLVRYFKLKGRDTKLGRFAKLELIPPYDGKILDINAWSFKVDEGTEPNWLADIRNQTEKRVRSIAASFIISAGEKDLILDGCWIVGKKAHIQEIRGGRIVWIGNSATIGEVKGLAEIMIVSGSAKIRYVGGWSRIASVCEKADIRYVGDYSQIDYIYGSATIRDFGGRARMNSVYGTAKVVDIHDRAHICFICGCARIGNIYGSATIEEVTGSTKIGNISGLAKIVKDNRVRQ